MERPLRPRPSRVSPTAGNVSTRSYDEAVFDMSLTLLQGKCRHSERPRGCTSNVLGIGFHPVRCWFTGWGVEYYLSPTCRCRARHQYLDLTPSNQENQLHRFYQRRIHHCQPRR